MAFKTGSQSSTAVKICGITELHQAKAIAALGVDALGIIGVKESPRFVNEDNRRKIFDELSKSFPNTKRVWVIADLTDSEISNHHDNQLKHNLLYHQIIMFLQ